MATALPVIAITAGEPAGIGPDLLALLAARPALPAGARWVAIADRHLLASRAAQLGVDAQWADFQPDAPAPARGLEVLHVPLAAPAEAGVLNAANGRYVLNTLDAAIDGCLAGQFAAMVTAPVHKGVINDAGVAFSGHTEYLAERTHTRVVDHPLVHRGGDHGGKLPGQTAVNRGVERVEHIATVGGVEHAGLGWRGERHMQHFQAARRGGGVWLKIRPLGIHAQLRGAAGQQMAVGNRHPARASGQRRAGGQQRQQIRADAGGFAGGDGDHRQGCGHAYCSFR
jgi:hypothetical protein